MLYRPLSPSVSNCVCVCERECVCVCSFSFPSASCLSACLCFWLSPCLLAVACQVRANVGDSALSLNSRSNTVIASHRDTMPKKST